MKNAEHLYVLTGIAVANVLLFGFGDLLLMHSARLLAWLTREITRLVRRGPLQG